MDCKEDISDSDSGIMLHSGPDSPSSPVKDLTTHTRAMRIKHQALEDRLELCLLELRKLCIREAELTGKLSPDYPLSPDEKPPQIHRRIGAAFKLDEGLIHQDGEESVLSSLEAELSLQRQICEAARRLSLEENLSKPVRKSRLQQCKRQERKMRELQENIFQHRIRHGCASPQMCHAKQRDLSISDDSSLSDAAAVDDESDFSPSMVPSSTDSPPPPSLSPSHSPYPSTGSQSASLSVCSSTTSLDYQRCPIQNSPWKESSLDLPYQKNKTTPSASSSRSSSPSGTPVQAGVELRLSELPPPMQLAAMRSLALLPTLSTSAPSTPELPVRRQLSQSFRLPRNKPDFGKFTPEQSRGRVPRQRVGELVETSPENSPPACQSSSEDSSSEHSVPSYAGSHSRNDLAKAGRPIPPPYGYHLNSKHKGPAVGEAHSYKNNNGHQSAANNVHHQTNNGHHLASNHQANNINRNQQHQPGTNNEVHIKKINQQHPASNRDAHVYKNNNSNQHHPPPRSVAKEGSSLEAKMDKMRIDPSSPARPVLKNDKASKEVPSPKRSGKPPPPPYARLVRTPSLKEYPTHISRRLLPREIVCEELKMWHQHNSLQGLQPQLLKRQGSLRMKPSPSREPPTYRQVCAQNQAPQVVILQRAPDGTPMQWFEEEDAEIVSQV